MRQLAALLSFCQNGSTSDHFRRGKRGRKSESSKQTCIAQAVRPVVLRGLVCPETRAVGYLCLSHGLSSRLRNVAAQPCGGSAARASVHAFEPRRDQTSNTRSSWSGTPPTASAPNASSLSLSLARSGFCGMSIYRSRMILSKQSTTSITTRAIPRASFYYSLREIAWKSRHTGKLGTSRDGRTSPLDCGSGPARAQKRTKHTRLESKPDLACIQETGMSQVSVDALIHFA